MSDANGCSAENVNDDIPNDVLIAWVRKNGDPKCTIIQQHQHPGIVARYMAAQAGDKPQPANDDKPAKGDTAAALAPKKEMTAKQLASRNQYSDKLFADLKALQDGTKVLPPPFTPMGEPLTAKQRAAEELSILQKMGIVWPDTNKDGISPLHSIQNCTLAIETLGIRARYDQFHDRIFITVGKDHNWVALSDGLLTDHAEVTIRSLVDEAFKQDFGNHLIHDSIVNMAYNDSFNPVCEMLEHAEASHDRDTRLTDMFAVDHLNCQDTELNREIARLMLVAAVHRARHPGCKCDYIWCLLSKQGFMKSTAFEVLAGKENFSDQQIFGLSDKVAMEQLAGVWIHENGELQGLARAEINSITVHLSRNSDRARKAYGRNVEIQPRRSIEVGSSNEMSGILRKQTGNRRWLLLEPLKPIDIAKLKADRLQLWGEAAAIESAMVEELGPDFDISLPKHFWAASGEVQERHRERHIWEDLLATMPDAVKDQGNPDPHAMVTIIHVDANGKERVATADILQHVLRLTPGQLNRDTNNTLAAIMRNLGWQRQSNRYVTINGQPVVGFYRNGDLLSEDDEEAA